MPRGGDRGGRVKTLIKPWKGLKREKRRRFVRHLQPGENPNKTLEGIKTLRGLNEFGLTCGCENPNKTLEGIKTESHLRRPPQILAACENPNKTLEGIKTLSIFSAPSTNVRPVKTLIKPWKGLKRVPVCPYSRARPSGVKTLIKPWKGLKPQTHKSRCWLADNGENPNKTLEGIKTV
ncbi:hypothetical protein U27_01411 [Candidatus Vecturithrix granuli]|uniref:Uncharacterized protein n=1 Tax=Vecturithrix granuli TaxID=1499967 RepID=A0A081CAA5_VECG1|nr:hypothetical protein U27_01411 [Candidatus Vecturithrix granuli]